MLYYIFLVILLAGSLWCAWQISVSDWRRRIIPDAYLFPLMLIGLVLTNWFIWPISPRDGITAAIFGYVITSVISMIFAAARHKNNDLHAPIGLGDIKLISVGGIWLGTTGLASALVIACIAGIVWGARKHQKYIPFAPFFIGGGILSLIVICFLI